MFSRLLAGMKKYMKASAVPPSAKAIGMPENSSSSAAPR
jgi:hypothetical protein